MIPVYMQESELFTNSLPGTSHTEDINIIETSIVFKHNITH